MKNFDYMSYLKNKNIENDEGIICINNGTAWFKRSFIISLILRELRVQFGYTQEYIAIQLNMPQNQYSRYERGANLPTIETLIRISFIYKVSLNYLCGTDIENYDYAYEKSMLKYSNDQERAESELFLSKLKVIYTQLYNTFLRAVSEDK